jgi:hypothetical protein
MPIPNPWQDMRAVRSPQSGSKKQAACQRRPDGDFIVFPEIFVDSVSLTRSGQPETRLLAEHRVLQNEASPITKNPGLKVIATFVRNNICRIRPVFRI